jgi:hypothetical protein
MSHKPVKITLGVSLKHLAILRRNAPANTHVVNLEFAVLVRLRSGCRGKRGYATDEHDAIFEEGPAGHG